MKIDAFKDPKIISKIFDISLKESIKITRIFSKKRLNKSPGIKIVKITFFINKILKIFNLSLLDLYNFQK